ncbi:glycine--tRNA ligase subunit beta [Helicobacter pylori]|uniref:glycine--tRNA ligase subunit beta n=1 Tax=Helicobacter pylori TaxID=210 RepID=UPI001AA9A913|nr:glycine--tRNA ligase subunit beta [Helicobacter pylori]BDO46565.1 Glycyl-tRNA synthetase subunit beta GlyS [Helicobacter pylori]GHP38199.1 glycine--tRNA ligase beta subunit [Helicobacter pylori]GHQ45753.1 glycine--tRNA ligase beta subunit [Helicobacter pylori]GHR46653.1 glycine--tRNA ligase beta subunit [Helicobacter pylori]
MHSDELLVEILVEELPAQALLNEYKEMPKKLQALFQKRALEVGNIEIFYTPRRLCLLVKDFPLLTQETKEEFFGPPVKIACNHQDKTQGLNELGLGFYQKLGLKDHQHFQTAFKNNKEVLYHAKIHAKEPTKDLIMPIVLEFLEGLNFGKSMRWGSVEKSFIRPIHNICVLFNGENFNDIEVKEYGFKTKQATKAHRQEGFDFIQVDNPKAYFEVLEKNHVILDPKKREARILQEIKELETKHRIIVEIDRDLLDEVVAITEYPSALLGEFDKAFLKLPSEIITTSMKENQRYFAAFNQKSQESPTLHNGFIVVSNAINKDKQKIIAGNQKVLKARLSDAVFFYENDLKKPLDNAPLESVVFVQGLGTLKDKMEREAIIAQYLTQKYAPSLNMSLEKALELVGRAVRIAKADLLSEVVYEFSELQGIMGYYYALKQNENELVALSVKEQYLPASENAPLPSSVFSAIVALSLKLDSLFSLFSVGKIPSGSKDPFALRRLSFGLLKIVAHYGLGFDLKADLKNLFEKVGVYQSFDLEVLEKFLLERFNNLIDCNPSIIRSVLNTNERDIVKIIQKVKALKRFLDDPKNAQKKELLFSAFKRLANINKDRNPNESSEFSISLFKELQEHALFEAFNAIKTSAFESLDSKIEAYFGLHAPLEEYFKSVLVMDKDIEIQKNRKNFLWGVYQSFLEIGDIKEIAI